MMLNFTHASNRLGTKPAAINASRLILDDDSNVVMMAMFKERYERLVKRGELTDLPKRLVDRRPVDVKPETATWSPEPKTRKQDKRVKYDSPLLNSSMRATHTAYTKGEAVDMTNRVTEERPARKALWEARVIAEAKAKREAKE